MLLMTQEPPSFDSRDPEFAWACGFFEGEGTIHVKDEYQARIRRLHLHNTDLEAIKRMQGAFGGIGSIHVRKPAESHNKPQWQWQAGAKKEIQPLLVAMLPWLGAARKTKATKALEMLARTYPNPNVPGRRKTVCKRGHSLTDPTNIYVAPNGKRRCRACQNMRQLRYYHEKKNGTAV